MIATKTKVSALRSAIQALLEKTGYTMEFIRDEYRKNGLSETRMLWDTYWAATKGNAPLRKEFYGMNDSHIETAIKAALRGIRP